MKRTFTFLWLMLLAICSWAQREFHSKIVDAETSEPLPYVSIYVSENHGTLTNADGNFTISTDANDSLKVTFIGYEPMMLRAGELPLRIEMRPLTNVLHEVTVMPILDIIKKVSQNINKEYRRERKRRGKYFYRLNTTFSEEQELAEAFVEGQSAVNLRSILVSNGRRFRQSEDIMRNSLFDASNLHHLLELGPIIKESAYWNALTTPLIEKTDQIYLDDKYALSCEVIRSADNSEVYKIRFAPSERSRMLKRWILTGDLYVEPKTFHVLHFKGEILNATLEVARDMRREKEPVKLCMSVDYSHEKGYTEVVSANQTLVCGNMKTHSFLYKIEDLESRNPKNSGRSDNLFELIDKAGYNPNLWKEEIVQRTAREEELVWKVSKKELADTISPSSSERGSFNGFRERLTAFGKTIPQEKVFVHMDNTSYFLGDTIWFSAYTRQTNTDTPSKVSGVLYAELYNNDGYLVERKLIEIKDGRGNGFFALNSPIQYSGFYELRAYTRWQLNWGLYEHKHGRASKEWFLNKGLEKDYYKDYYKLYSRVFPVYDKPTDKENPERNMTARIMRRYFKKDMDEEERELTLALFPEGGNLVASVPNRVAFEAKWNDGEELEGTLNIGGETIPAVNRGRGVFTITPEHGMEREVTFTAKDGKKVSAKLPKPDEQGVVLNVKQDGDDWVLSTQIAGDLSPENLAMTIMHEGKVEEFYEVQKVQRVQSSKLPVGIHQVTVFDTQGRVYADRLFFVTKPELSKPTLTVSGLKDEYEPYEKIELQVATTTPLPQREGMGLSFSVRDGYQQDQLFDNGNIMTEMLLASEVKGFIPNPGWYFERDDEQHRQALDLLMMTQGWRRFVWKDMAVKGEWDLTQPAEMAPVIQGTVYNLDYRLLDEGIAPISSHGDMKKSEVKDEYDLDFLAIENLMDMAERMPQEGTSDNSLLNQEPKKDYEQGQEKAGGVAASLKTITYQQDGNLKNEVRVHAELIHPDGVDIIVGEKETKNGQFRIQLPRYYDKAIFFLAASDTTKWKNGKEYEWTQMLADYRDLPAVHGRRYKVEPPEFFVRVSFPYPHFVSPYNYYQEHLLQPDVPDSPPEEMQDDRTRQLKEVPVKGRRRSGLRKFDNSQPAFLIDAYEARNLHKDSGMMFGHMIRSLMSDYGLDFPYIHKEGVNWGDLNKNVALNDDNIKMSFGKHLTEEERKQLNIPEDSIYSSRYLDSYGLGYDIRGVDAKYDIFSIDKIAVYTDYCPRLEGSKRYQGSNLPETRLVVFPYPDNSQRVVYRDRYYILPGFAYPAEFYNPDYSKQTPPEPTDYRRTLYWNPGLKLDEKGEAHVTLWNNSRTTHPNVEAAGQTAEGGLLWNK
ncbi:MAG: carboxypeptidase-like regulatory domain-containing protein [Bacteroidaceae bacterium]|nr:carboxypeptidase-like regulatory domain-containing protein [Bacteroidaceae bacterium]